MRKFEFCQEKGCERWRSFGGEWNEKPFDIGPDERLGWRATTCPQHRPEGVRPPIIVYCLYLHDGDPDKRCQMTTYHGLNDWAVDMDRISEMKSGAVAAMMGPYCSTHRAERQHKKGA